jgi:outer membrane immunogenic protein
MKRWLLAGTLSIAAGGQGLASDLPPPAVPPAPRAPAAYIPPVSPVYNWGGIYFGFNLGYGFGTSNWIDATDPGGATGNFNVNGFLAGATLGANFQSDSFVYGAEATAPFWTAKSRARSAAPARNARPRISGFRRSAP